MVIEDCYYEEADLPASWKRMEIFAAGGTCSWTKTKSFPQFRRISILCCLSQCCSRRSENCELDANAALFFGRNKRRRGVSVAIQVFPEPKDGIFLRNSDRKIIWLDPFCGYIFRGNNNSFGKEIDHILGADVYEGMEIKLRCYALCDVSSKQQLASDLRTKEDWDLPNIEGTIYIEVTGVPR